MKNPSSCVSLPGLLARIFILAAGIAAVTFVAFEISSSRAATARKTHAAQAAHDDQAPASRTIADYRAAGQRGLDELMAANRELIERMRSGATPLSDPDASKLRKALDAVAMQCDAYASGLYWHTDLDRAKAAANSNGKRILSLRLLGNLDEEFSCANSRFFRTALYANKDVAAWLRENFVLHWKSVRPVPKLTIAMGDGRRIERTIAGNSIHYVLDADGTVLDAIPGLYGPAAFCAALRKTDALPAMLRIGVATGQDTAGLLAGFHNEAANASRRAWLADGIRCGAYGEPMARGFATDRGRELFASLAPFAFPSENLAADPKSTNVGALVQKTAANATARPETNGLTLVSLPQPAPSGFPTAIDASARVVGKTAGEGPILRRIMRDGDRPNGGSKSDDPSLDKSLPDRMTPALWKKLALLRLEDVKLDEASRRLMISKLPMGSVTAEERASGRVIDESTPFANTLRKFEGAMAEDTVRNEFTFHIQIHQWLADRATGMHLARDVEALNRKIYAELFLTPDEDSWLGLIPENVYTALENDGCIGDASLK